MPSRTKGFFLAVLILALSPSGLAQTKAMSATTASMPSMQMTNIPYFSLRDGMDSTLTLNNLAPSPTAVNVTIFNTNGDAQPLTPMTLPAHSITEVDLSKSVRDDSFDSGNIEISYSGQMMQVTAQVSIFSIDKRVDIESREADMMDFASTSLAGILSLSEPDAEGFIAVTNVAPTTVPVTLTVGEHHRELRLAPRETQLIRLNGEFSDRPPSASLIRLQGQGLPGDIIATGYVLNRKTGYSSAFWMVDPASAGSNTLAGVHFWAGTPPKEAGFPEGTYFHSPLVLANVSGVTVNADVFVDYTQVDTSTEQPATTNSPSASSEVAVKHMNVGELAIPPGTVQTTDLADAAAKLGAESMSVNGFEVNYSGNPGSLIGHLTSSDASGDYSFEVPVRDPAGKDVTAGGGYPWTLQNGTDTTLHLMNTTDEATYAIVEFRFPDGTAYDPHKIALQPHETFAIDIQKLRGSKQVDIHNNLFATTEDHGQLIWSAGTLHTLIGRAEQVNVGEGFARSFSCGECVCPYTVGAYYMIPTGSSTFTVGYDNTSTSYDYYPYEYMQDCYGYYYGPYDVSYVWSSTNPSIATVEASPGDFGGDIQALVGGSATALNDWTEEGYRDDGIGDCIDEGPVDYEVAAQVNVTGGPTIMSGGCNGTNVTGQTTSVVIGQQVALCATGTYASGVSVSSYAWSIPGVSVANYSASVAAGTLTTYVPTNQSTVTFYWPYTATNQVVTLTVTLSNGIATSASATFNISGPNPDTPQISLPYNNGAMSIITLTDCNGNPENPIYYALDFGNISGMVPSCGHALNPPPGIAFTPPAPNVPASAPGNFFFVQLIVSDIITMNNSSYCSSPSGLDHQYPFYSTVANNGLNIPVYDSPFNEVTGFTSSTRQFEAYMFLMWQSTTANSIPVPIGKVDWGFNGGATLSGNWTSNGGGYENGFATASTTSDFPQWTNSTGCTPGQFFGGVIIQ